MKEVLNDCKDHPDPGLVMSWVIFGPSGREERPETGGVIILCGAQCGHAHSVCDSRA